MKKLHLVINNNSCRYLSFVFDRALLQIRKSSHTYNNHFVFKFLEERRVGRKIVCFIRLYNPPPPKMPMWILREFFLDVCRELQVCLRIRCLKLSGLNESWNNTTHFKRALHYKMSWKSVQWVWNCCRHMEGQRHVSNLLL